MITYRYPEEREVALLLANQIGDSQAIKIIENGIVSNSSEATHLAKFFWAMVNYSANNNVSLPFEGSTQYWTEKLYNSIGGYLESAGYEQEWDQEIDNA